MRDGKLVFGSEKWHPQQYLPGGGGWRGFSSGGRGGGIPVDGYVVGHAIILLDKLLDARGDAGPNIVEQKVTPALIVWGYNGKGLYIIDLAVKLGGPDVERFLLRQNYNQSAEDLPYNQRWNIHGSKDYNGWA